MTHILVRYRVRPEFSDENERLIRAVFEELERKQIAGVSYTVTRLEDDSFVHLAGGDTRNVFSSLPSFLAFQEGLAARCVEEPTFYDATVIGHHGNHVT